MTPGERLSPQATQDALTQQWRKLWENWSQTTQTPVVVPECDRTTLEIKDLTSRGRMLIYLPHRLSRAEELPALQRLIPQEVLGGGWRPWAPTDTPNSYDGSWTTNHYEQFGWLSVESANKLAENPLHKSKDNRPNQETLGRRRAIEEGELVGQTANAYVLGSLYNKLMTEHYFDENWHYYDSKSLLFGSAIHHGDSKGLFFVPYAGVNTRIGRGDIWSWCGPIDYSAARTVELQSPLTKAQVILPEQRFRAINAYKEVLPPSS